MSTKRSELTAEEQAELARVEAMAAPLGYVVTPIYERRADGSQAFIANGPGGAQDWVCGGLAFLAARLKRKASAKA
jgi:hypothetical protein